MLNMVQRGVEVQAYPGRGSNGPAPVFSTGCHKSCLLERFQFPISGEHFMHLLVSWC